MITDEKAYPDYVTRGKYLELALRLKGHLSDKKKDNTEEVKGITVQVVNYGNVQLEDLKPKKLLENKSA